MSHANYDEVGSYIVQHNRELALSISVSPVQIRDYGPVRDTG